MREGKSEMLSEVLDGKNESVCAQFEQDSDRAMQKSVHQRAYPAVSILAFAIFSCYAWCS